MFKTIEYQQTYLYNLYIELKNSIGLKMIVDYLNIHIGTIKRWEKNKKIPINYFLDFLSLNNNNELIKKYLSISNNKTKDQYFTKPEIAKAVFKKGLDVLRLYKINLDDYTYIEPSVGMGSFFNLLPQNKIGIDIEPKVNDKRILEHNYLDFVPTANSKKYIVIGNPPFGLRGNMALRFINHSRFADIIIMILPPLFNSNGKGCPKKRVKFHKLIYSENLPSNSFVYPNNREVKVSTIMQVWVNKEKFSDINGIENEIDNKETIRIYSLSNGKNSSSKRNVKMINKCDLYLPSTCYSGMKVYTSFDKLPNNRGYGVVFLKEKEQLTKYFKKINWLNFAFRSTNSALNLRSGIINQVVSDYYIKNGKIK